MCGFATANFQNPDRQSQLYITTAKGGGFLLRTKHIIVPSFSRFRSIGSMEQLQASKSRKLGYSVG
jgi:hypothetical protein